MKGQRTHFAKGQALRQQWEEVLDDTRDEWEYAYLPYQDEAPRQAGAQMPVYDSEPDPVRVFGWRLEIRAKKQAASREKRLAACPARADDDIAAALEASMAALEEGLATLDQVLAATAGESGNGDARGA